MVCGTQPRRVGEAKSTASSLLSVDSRDRSAADVCALLLDALTVEVAAKERIKPS